MPRVLICCGPRAAERLAAGLRRFGPPGATDSVLRREDLALYISAALDDDSGISVRSDVVLALEGFVTHRPERGAALRTALIEDFLAHGERCVARWRGSFRVLIARGGVTRVYTDHTAGRALFVADDGSGPVFGSHTAPLLDLLPRVTPDGANLLRFLRDGRFFAGASLYREVRQLAPGECWRVGVGAGGGDEGGRATARFAWYRYELRPEPLDVRDAVPELKRRLDVAVHRHWERAEAPALLLSGGYDSRYLLNTLAEQVRPESLRRLLTCLWGEPNPDPGSDAAWAGREARRHGVAFEFTPLATDLPGLFEATVAAQSGMTAHALTHTDDLACCRRLRERGYRSLIRGDEVFGPNGPEVPDPAAALARVGVHALPPELPWLTPDAPAAEWRAAYEHRLRELEQTADDPNDLRDLLYFHERLPSVQSHLNAHRSPFVENHNPLLDADVLDLVRVLPRALRTDKRLFRLCFQRYFPTPGFAISGNAFDPGRLWRRPDLAAFVADRLERLPAPLAGSCFGPLATRFRQAAAGTGPPPTDEQIHLGCRAVVLGEGLRHLRTGHPVPEPVLEPVLEPGSEAGPESEGCHREAPAR